METDRPDVTESPFTVDPGHWQYESDLLRYQTRRSENLSEQTLLINQLYLKAGILGSTELQLGLQSFGYQQQQSGPQKQHSHGTGDFSLRLKQNLIGNDKGNFSAAIMPYLRFPTSSFQDSRYETGLILPMQLQLPAQWKLGFQLEADRLKDDQGSSMHTELLQSLTLSHSLISSLDGTLETYYTYDCKAHHWANFLNAALQLGLTKKFKLDAGLNYGLQHDAEKACFLGTAIKF